jgi:hypothetical protein
MRPTRERLADLLRPDFPVRRLSRTQVKALVTAKLVAGLSKNSVRLIHTTLHAVLEDAVDDAILKQNPAARRSRSRKNRMTSLASSAAVRADAIKAMTREQLSGFLVATLSARAPPLPDVLHARAHGHAPG